MRAMTAWLPSMAPAAGARGRTGFNLPSRGWTVNEIPSTPLASLSRRIKVVGSRSTRVPAGSERPLRLPLATGCTRSVPRAGAAEKAGSCQPAPRIAGEGGACPDAASASEKEAPDMESGGAPRRITTSSASIAMLVLGGHRRSTPCPRLVPQHRPARRVVGGSGIHLGARRAGHVGQADGLSTTSACSRRGRQPNPGARRLSGEPRRRPRDDPGRTVTLSTGNCLFFTSNSLRII